jgi:hypothetical protein
LPVYISPVIVPVVITADFPFVSDVVQNHPVIVFQIRPKNPDCLTVQEFVSIAMIPELVAQEIKIPVVVLGFIDIPVLTATILGVLITSIILWIPV